MNLKLTVLNSVRTLATANESVRKEQKDYGAFLYLMIKTLVGRSLIYFTKRRG